MVFILSLFYYYYIAFRQIRLKQLFRIREAFPERKQRNSKEIQRRTKEIQKT